MFTAASPIVAGSPVTRSTCILSIYTYVYMYDDADCLFSVVYGPLCNGATTVMFESVPTHPNPYR